MDNRGIREDSDGWWRKWADPKAVEDMLRGEGYEYLEEVEVHELVEREGTGIEDE